MSDTTTGTGGGGGVAPRSASLRHRLVRWPLVIATAVVAAVIVAQRQTYRNSEAGILAWVFRVTWNHHVVARAATIWTGWETPHLAGVTVTPVCSSAPYVAGFLGITSILLASRRWRYSTIFIAASVAVGIVVVVNLARIALLVVADRSWGNSGFEWVHVYVGTTMSVFALIGGVAVYLLVLFRQRTGREVA